MPQPPGACHSHILFEAVVGRDAASDRIRRHSGFERLSSDLSVGHATSAGAPAERFYSTSTTARIQGWIQHWNLCTPGESPLIWAVSPGATIPGAARQATAGTNGTVPAGPPTPLRGGTNPPPNAVTSVNVWPSPPAFVARTVCPAR